jgi:TolB protein
LTNNPAIDSSPCYSPDGRLIAYVSNRGGLYIQNPETHHEVQVWRGSASSPSWGPAPRQ